MQVLAFRHTPLEGTGSIAAALARHNVACRIVDLPTEPPGLTDVSGLIVMGGPMSVNDDLPWIPYEIAAIQAAHERGIPVLGICLGAQLVARALGALVYPNGEKEIGWFRLRWTDAARADTLFRGLPDPQVVFQWHGETFDLPPGAQHLAYSEVCRNQAFRAGGNIYGIQFHLEVTPGMIAEWLRQDAACGDAREAFAPIDPEAHATALADAAATVFDRWCGLLR